MYDKIQQLQQLDSSDEEEEPVFLYNDFHTISPMKHQKNFSNSIKSAMFNLRYNIIHSNYVPIPSFQRKPIDIQPGCNAILMGQSYDCALNEEFVKRFQDIIWFSYRTSQEGFSDVGWGCMIRVVQMILAQTLQRCNLHQSPSIIGLFKQGSEPIFSLQNICKEGDFFERWVSCNEVVAAIASITKNDSLIKNIQIKQQLKLGLDLDIYHGLMDIRHQKQEQNIFPKVVFISSTKVMDTCENETEKFYSHFKRLMSFKQFCGAAGGTGQQALYIVGVYEDKAIILDPHYAQEEENCQKLVYYKTTPRGINLSKLASSFTFCYYFHDLEEYKDWIAQIIYLQRIYCGYTLFEIITENNEEIYKNRKGSEDFEIL